MVGHWEVDLGRGSSPLFPKYNTTGSLPRLQNKIITGPVDYSSIGAHASLIQPHQISLIVVLFKLFKQKYWRVRIGFHDVGQFAISEHPHR